MKSLQKSGKQNHNVSNSSLQEYQIATIDPSQDDKFRSKKQYNMSDTEDFKTNDDEQYRKTNLFTGSEIRDTSQDQSFTRGTGGGVGGKDPHTRNFKLNGTEKVASNKSVTLLERAKNDEVVNTPITGGPDSRQTNLADNSPDITKFNRDEYDLKP